MIFLQCVNGARSFLLMKMLMGMILFANSDYVPRRKHENQVKVNEIYCVNAGDDSLTLLVSYCSCFRNTFVYGTNYFNMLHTWFSNVTSTFQLSGQSNSLFSVFHNWSVLNSLRQNSFFKFSYTTWNLLVLEKSAKVQFFSFVKFSVFNKSKFKKLDVVNPAILLFYYL